LFESFLRLIIEFRANCLLQYYIIQLRVC